MKKLGINGKVVDVSNLAKKTKAQFGAQLKKAGVELDEERLEALYTSLHDRAVDEEATAGMTKEEKQAYFDQKHPERAEMRRKMEEENRTRAEFMKHQAEIIAKQRAASLKAMAANKTVH